MTNISSFPRCATCRHWGPNSGSEPRATLRARDGIALGDCLMMGAYMDEPDRPETLAFADGYDGVALGVATKETFGCVMHSDFAK